MGRIDLSANIGKALRNKQRGFLLNPYRFGVPAAPRTPPNISGTRVEIGPGSGNSNLSGSIACTNGQLCTGIIRWVGSGITAATPTFTSGGAGETITLHAASHAVNANAEHCQAFSFIAASTATKTIDVDFSGSTTQHGGTLINWTPHDSSPIGNIVSAVDNSTTVPQLAINTTQPNSTLLCCVMCGNAPGTLLDTGPDPTDLNINANWNFEEAQYVVNVGSVGTKTVGWNSTVAPWAMFILEILGAP